MMMKMKKYRKPKTRLIKVSLSSFITGSPDGGSELGGPTTDPFLAPKVTGRIITDDDEKETE